MVDLVGIEPTTSSMPWKRAPSCATGPLGIGQNNSRLPSNDSQTRPGIAIFLRNGEYPFSFTNLFEMSILKAKPGHESLFHC